MSNFDEAYFDEMPTQWSPAEFALYRHVVGFKEVIRVFAADMCCRAALLRAATSRHCSTPKISLFVRFCIDIDHT